MQVVPPTALAFEHTAVLAPADFLPPDEEITDPGRPDPTVASEDGTPTPAKDPRQTKPLELGQAVNATRTSFGVTFEEVSEPKLERSLIQEIEAVDGPDDIASDPEADTSAYGTGSGRWKKVLLFGGVFLAATGLGFLGVWLALR